MTTSETNFTVYTADSVQEFLDYLLPSASHWNFATRGDLAYRGQASSCWPLLPKAFRTDQVVGYDTDAPKGFLTRVTPQSRAEFRALYQFINAADASGLQITEVGGRLLLQSDPRRFFNDIDWEYSWPQEEIFETLALAQHHGVPTRLLDFSEDPLVAAYFASSFALPKLECQKSEKVNSEYWAVWVIDLRFIRALNQLASRYPERIGEVRVPRANNSYLHAQFGFFLLDRGANDVMNRGELLSLDKAAADRAGFWNHGNRLAEKSIDPMWFDENPIRQVRIPTTHTRELLKELKNRGITKGSVMPSLDRVVESLEFQRNIL